MDKDQGLTSVTIPSSVIRIDSQAFSGCTGLSSVTIPERVTYTGSSVFSGCTGLTSVTLRQGLIHIGDNMFNGCTGLTSVTIPASVTTIGGGSAFSGCSRLESIIVDPGNQNYANAGGVLLDATRNALIRCPEGKAGAYTIPSSVTTIDYSAFSDCIGLTSVTILSGVGEIGYRAFSGCTGLTSVTLQQGLYTIGDYAFSGCSGLTSVIIPASVTSVAAGNGCESECSPFGWTFSECSALTSAVFLGDAPNIGPGVFFGTAPGFRVYYLSGREGFTSPIWNGYPAVVIAETTHPAASWLLEHGLWYDTDLHPDPDSDGVSLLMAYALDLDPNLNLQGSLPVPALNGNTLSLSFHSTSPGITYKVETSTDLHEWKLKGVTQSAPGPDGRSTATVSLDSPRRFLRLTVED